MNRNGRNTGGDEKEWKGAGGGGREGKESGGLEHTMTTEVVLENGRVGGG